MTILFNNSVNATRGMLRQSILIVCCLWFVNLANANDLVVEPNSFDVDYNLNSSLINNSERTVYNRDDFDTLFAETELIVTWPCDATIFNNTCRPKPSNVEITYQAVAFSVNVLGEETIFSTHAFIDNLVTLQPNDIRYRDCGPNIGCQFSANETVSIDIIMSSVNTNGDFDRWVAEARVAEKFIRFTVQINGNGKVPENDITNNSAEFFIPSLFPITGDLFFGGVKTQVTGPVDYSVACSIGAGTTRFMGGFNWTPSINNLWPDKNITGVDICARHTLNAIDGRFDFHAEENVAVNGLEGQHGGFTISIPTPQLTPLGILFGGLGEVVLIPLPPGLSYHASDNDLPSPQGRRELDLPLPVTVLTDLNQLALSTSSGFLHSRLLPFSVEINQLNFDTAGLLGTFLGTHHNQTRRFTETDPRHSSYHTVLSDGLKSNDLRFRTSASPDNPSLEVTENGLNFVANFAGVFGYTHFPQANNFWAPFSIQIENSELVEKSLTGDAQSSLDMSAGCAQCGSQQDIQNEYLLIGDNTSGISSDGASAFIASGGVDPAWGDYDTNNAKATFTRSGDAQRAGLFYIPGFRALGSGGADNIPVAEYLLGSREISDVSGSKVPTTLFPLSSNNAQLGNHFFPGFNLGPEYYSLGVNREPEVGIGSNLSGSVIEIGFGGIASPDYVPLSSNIGTKYVVRPGGLTGVFNVDSAPSPVVYGYDLALSRFAFRQINNTLDTYSWIDGAVSVEGKGGFDISFSSLGLECSGNLGGGIVDFEACGDSIDNNNNGVIDENCNETLSAWNTSIDLISMNFAADNQGQCLAEQRILNVSNTVKINALDSLLGLQASWSALGEPSNIVLTGDSNSVLDRPAQPSTPDDDHGFPILLNKDIEMKTPGGSSNEDGWFAIDGTIGVPFWDAMSVSTRVANASITEPSQSIVLEKNGSLFGSVTNDDNRDNEQLSARLKSHGSFDSEYTWGATNYSLALPVYYQPSRLSDNKRPQFAGVKQEVDLLVMDIDGGIDYIDPSRTKISFGASADFETLAQLELDLHIDLNNPDSIMTIDDALCTLPIGCSTNNRPVESLISDVHSQMNLLNIVADSGLSEFLETGLRTAFSVVPFAELSDAINQIQSLPEQVAVSISSSLNDLTTQLLAPLTDQLDSAAITIYNDLPSLIVQADTSAVNTPQLNDELNRVNDIINQLSAGLGSVEATIVQAEAQVDTAREDFLNFVTSTADWVEVASTTIDDVRVAINQISSVCSISGDNSNPLWEKVLSSKDILGDAISAVNVVELDEFADFLSPAVSIDLQAISNAQNNIEKLSDELLVRLNEGVEEFEDLCGTELDFSTAYESAETFLDNIDGILDEAVNNIVLLAVVLRQDQNFDGSIDGGLFASINEALMKTSSIVSILQSELGNLQFNITRALNDAQKTEFDNDAISTIQFKLDSLIKQAIGNDSVSWLDPATNKSFVVTLGDTLRAPIDTAIANATSQVSIILNDLLSSVPYSSKEQLETAIVDLVMNSSLMESLNQSFYTYFTEITADLNGLNNFVFDQANDIIQSAIVSIEEEANDLLQSATSTIAEGLPIDAASVDGYATIVGNQLERLHIGSQWTLSGDAEQNSSSFNAALDVTRWSANGKGDGCSGTDDLSSNLDAVISTKNLPISIAGSDASIKELYLGFTLESLAQDAVPVPVNVFGGISVDGTVSFEAFDIYDIGFAAGVGKRENYLGASAGAIFSDIQVDAAFLIGKTCNTDVLLALDSQAAEFLTFPNGVFNGAYARGSASIPIFTAGCALTVGVGADAGAWLLAGPPLTYGGVVGGSAYGEAACIASIRGQVTVFGEKSGDQYKFRGEAFGVAGAGFDCDPETWTSVPRSRNDGWCGTGDAEISIDATVNGSGSIDWGVGSPSASAIH